MFLLKRITIQNSYRSTIYVGLNYQSHLNYYVRIRKDRRRDLNKIEDPASSMDPAYLQPHVKKWKHWKWNWLPSPHYSKLKQIRDRKKAMYDKEEELPYWYDTEDQQKLNVIFIRDMDEFLAGKLQK
eukprot:190914_1